MVLTVTMTTRMPPYDLIEDMGNLSKKILCCTILTIKPHAVKHTKSASVCDYKYYKLFWCCHFLIYWVVLLAWSQSSGKKVKSKPSREPISSLLSDRPGIGLTPDARYHMWYQGWMRGCELSLDKNKELTDCMKVQLCLNVKCEECVLFLKLNGLMLISRKPAKLIRCHTVSHFGNIHVLLMNQFLPDTNILTSDTIQCQILMV